MLPEGLPFPLIFTSPAGLRPATPPSIPDIAAPFRTARCLHHGSQQLSLARSLVLGYSWGTRYIPVCAGEMHQIFAEVAAQPVLEEFAEPEATNNEDQLSQEAEKRVSFCQDRSMERTLDGMPGGGGFRTSGWRPFFSHTASTCRCVSAAMSSVTALKMRMMSRLGFCLRISPAACRGGPGRGKIGGGGGGGMRIAHPEIRTNAAGLPSLYRTDTGWYQRGLQMLRPTTWIASQARSISCLSAA